MLYTYSLKIELKYSFIILIYYIYIFITLSILSSTTSPLDFLNGPIFVLNFFLIIVNV